MKAIKIVSAAVFAAAAAGAVFADEGPGTYFAPPEGTANVVEAAAANPAAKVEKTVAFLGGSITEMHGYRPRVMAALRAKYPDVAFREIAAGISSTCSDTGAFRLEEDVLSKGRPDLFFVEESVNDDQDGHFDRTHAVRGMEGILRHVREKCPECEIVVGLMVNVGQYKELMAGKIPFHNGVHREVARHYGAEVADVGAALAKSAKGGGFSWAQYRDCHPSPEGCDLAAKVVMEAVDRVFDPKAAATAHALPPPMDEKSYSRGAVVPFGALTGVDGWRKSCPNWGKVPGAKRAQFVRGDAIWSDVPGSSFAFSFRGTSAAAIMTAGPDVGALEVSVDGGDWRRVELASPYSRTLNYPHTKFLADDLAEGRHDVRVRAAEAEHPWGKGRAVRIHRLVVNGEAVLTYEQFGAVGDGRADDRQAIVRTHAAANECGAAVAATDGRVYYLGPGEGTAIVKTDVDWGTARFIIDDVCVSNRNSNAFSIVPSRDPFAVARVAPFRKGAARLDAELPCDCLLALENSNVRRYIRLGVNQNSGAAQKEVLLVRRDGSVDPAAPVVWDFDAVTRATAYPVDSRFLTVRGGVFRTIANQAESKYTYHSRGIEVSRSNVLLCGIRHEIEGELDHGAPYNGFIQIRRAANVTVKDCVFTAHRLYWTQGHGGMSPMGSYDLTVNEAVNASIVNCRQITDIDDRRYWGLFASNYSKNILFDSVEFSRFDAHMGVANATILNSRLGHMGINAIGCGTFRVENTEIRGPAVFNLRGDYGSTWEGDFVVKNCRLVTNGGSEAQPYLIRGQNTGKHDFGYVCRMPAKITFDGLVIDDSSHPKNYGGPYIFANFNGENTSDAYVERFPYHTTEEVVLSNVTTTSGKPVLLSPNKYMFRNVRVQRRP